LHLLSCLFSRLLSLDTDQSLLHHLSLETFAGFAELTTHESVVADSVAASDRTRQTVVDFLSHVSVTYWQHVANAVTHTHTHVHLTALFPGLPG